ncbi:Glycosyl hydrolase family 35 protein [Striga hermonthica]|uniref:Glycosyl hydrolase family 35 protein n=1 Tax=Striga hermonthica TaxID=68872 RepID=A0A9N7MKQ2_STRHE|nr:Glycosyl hydrolase family 35 protein [Striga hermonthica]
MVSIDWRNAMPLNIKRRKLKGNKNTNGENGDGKVGLEDYRAIDPIPSLTSSIRPGPIQHGTPLFPYIPEPSLPPPPFTQPKQDELP